MDDVAVRAELVEYHQEPWYRRWFRRTPSKEREQGRLDRISKILRKMIMMQLFRDIESQQKLIEYKGSSWWSRWFRRLWASSADSGDGV